MSRPVPDNLPTQVIVLVGGLGTRLRATVPDLPKVLAPVGGKPFLFWVMARLAREGFRRFVLATGYRATQVHDFFGDGTPWGWQVSYAVEQELLGTAGGIRNALATMGITARFTEPVLVINGDTYIDADLQSLVRSHTDQECLVTLALRPVADATRFGAVQLADTGRVVAFAEKQQIAQGHLVSAGVYVLQPRILDFIPSGRPVSLETEVFPQVLAAGEVLRGVILDHTFIDVGTAEGYQEMSRYVLTAHASGVTDR